MTSSEKVSLESTGTYQYDLAPQAANGEPGSIEWLRNSLANAAMNMITHDNSRALALAQFVEAGLDRMESTYQAYAAQTDEPKGVEGLFPHASYLAQLLPRISSEAWQEHWAALNFLTALAIDGRLDNPADQGNVNGITLLTIAYLATNANIQTLVKASGYRRGRLPSELMGRIYAWMEAVPKGFTESWPFVREIDFPLYMLMPEVVGGSKKRAPLPPYQPPSK